MTEEYKRLRSKSDRCVVAISLFTFTYLYVAISGTISKPGNHTPRRVASILARTPLSQIPASRPDNAATRALIRNIAGWHQGFPLHNQSPIRQFHDVGD